MFTTYNRILHTNTPAQYKLSVCISQVHVASHKWTSGSVPTGKGLKVSHDEFYWQTKSCRKSYKQKFSEAATETLDIVTID